MRKHCVYGRRLLARHRLVVVIMGMLGMCLCLLMACVAELAVSSSGSVLVGGALQACSAIGLDFASVHLLWPTLSTTTVLYC